MGEGSVSTVGSAEGVGDGSAVAVGSANGVCVAVGSAEGVGDGWAVAVAVAVAVAIVTAVGAGIVSAVPQASNAKETPTIKKQILANSNRLSGPTLALCSRNWLDDFGWHTCGDHIGRDIFVDNATGRNHAVFSDGHPT